jgi:hypothetical protein
MRPGMTGPVIRKVFSKKGWGDCPAMPAVNARMI